MEDFAIWVCVILGFVVGVFKFYDGFLLLCYGYIDCSIFVLVRMYIDELNVECVFCIYIFFDE